MYLHFTEEKVEEVIDKIKRLKKKQAESADFFSPLWTMDYELIFEALNHYKDYIHTVSNEDTDSEI